MIVRTWISRLSEINIMLKKEFPPKFSTEQILDDIEFIEILKFSIPDTWRAKMVDQNFISANHTLTEVIEFCEKEQIIETMLSGRIPRNKSKPASNGKQESFAQKWHKHH